MAKQGGGFLQGALKYLAFYLLVAIALLLAGICSLSISLANSHQNCKQTITRQYKDVIKIDYTECTDNFGNKCSEKWTKTETPGGSCKCAEGFELTQDIDGEVIMLYQLESFNLSKLAQQENYFQSRDLNQLRGVLNGTVAKACEPYAYGENNLAIAPCGALADSMFNDEFEIIRDLEGDILPTKSSGILVESQKEGFRNPQTHDNLSIVFQNFSKPKSWMKNIWELDLNNPDNNGFQNEPFIAWMQTDLDKKPVWRLDRTGEFTKGLKRGNYTLAIGYNYSPQLYSGTRNAILAVAEDSSSCDPVTVTGTSSVTAFGLGLAGIIIGCLLLLLAAVVLVLHLRKNRPKQVKSELPTTTVVPNSTNNTTEKNDGPPVLTGVGSEQKLIKPKTAVIKEGISNNELTPVIQKKDEEDFL